MPGKHFKQRRTVSSLTWCCVECEWSQAEAALGARQPYPEVSTTVGFLLLTLRQLFRFSVLDSVLCLWLARPCSH